MPQICELTSGAGNGVEGLSAESSTKTYSRFMFAKAYGSTNLNLCSPH